MLPAAVRGTTRRATLVVQVATVGLPPAVTVVWVFDSVCARFSSKRRSRLWAISLEHRAEAQEQSLIKHTKATKILLGQNNSAIRSRRPESVELIGRYRIPCQMYFSQVFQPEKRSQFLDVIASEKERFKIRQVSEDFDV